MATLKCACNYLEMTLFGDDPHSIKTFLECLKFYCIASGSTINHEKIGIKTSRPPFPYWLLEQGYKVILKGRIFRLPRVLLGFNVSLKKMQDRVKGKLKEKFERWRGFQLSMASRVLILKNFLIPTNIYFFSC